MAEEMENAGSPEEKLKEIEALGDYWTRQLVTERQLRRSDMRRKQNDYLSGVSFTS